MGKPKKPRAAISPEVAKRPVVEAAGSSNGQSPVWSIALLDLDGPFGWRGVEAEVVWSLIYPRLRAFEMMTWQEILAPTSGCHPVETWKCCKEAQDRLRELQLDDVDSLMSLRIQGRERLWGIRSDRVFAALWWDPEHAICPSTKKHT